MTDDLSAPNDIAAAFEALRGEVSLTRAALEGLTAARERLPDYSPTLGQITRALQDAADGIARLEQSPAVRLSPAGLTAAILKASADARAEDHAVMQQTRDALSRAMGRIDGMVARRRGTAEQRQWLIWATLGGLVLGIWLWSIVPGAVARVLPASWHVPEWMAERILRMDAQDAAARLSTYQAQALANEEQTSPTP